MYGAAVRACARGGGTEQALFLLKDATKRGTPLPPADIADTMRAVSEEADGWQQALDLYEVFLQVGAEQAQERIASEASQGGLGLLDDADDQLPGPLSRQRRPLHLLSEISPGWEDVCQAALEACTRGGQWKMALEILNVLRAGGDGPELSREAYDEAIDVCGNGGAWDMVRLSFLETFSGVLGCACSMCREAHGVCVVVPNFGYESGHLWLDVHLFSLHAFCSAGRFSIGRLAYCLKLVPSMHVY